MAVKTQKRMEIADEKVVALLKDIETGDQTRADAGRATPEVRTFFASFFTAKSRHDVEGTMAHFSPQLITYADATLGSSSDSFQALKAGFAGYMPKWGPAGASYPTRILGNTDSALVAITDTPELFGGELRILAAVDFEDGKIIRWVDYWDGTTLDTKLYQQLRAPDNTFQVTIKPGDSTDSAAPIIRKVARALQSAFGAGDAKAAAALFVDDAVYEDMTLRTQLLGRAAIGRYLQRILTSVPYGNGSTLSHVVGGDTGGGFEWLAAPSTPVKFGITALELDADGKITRLTTLYDGKLLSNEHHDRLVSLSGDAL